MAVAIEMNFKDASIDQYDEVLKKMGLEHEGAAPPGALFHWVEKNGDGLRVVDVWESREVFDRFAQEQIGPYTREVGITEEPELSFHDVYNYIIAR
jgi:hypothetical protein